MPNIVVYRNGEKVLREQMPEDIPLQVDLDELADAITDRALTQQRDVTRAIGETLAEVIFRVSNGTVPQGVTEVQARNWVRNTFRDKYRALLG